MGLVQVAGVIDAAEAALLTEEGVDWLGFPLRLTVNDEDLTEDDATKVIAGIPAPRKGVLITYVTKASDITEFCRDLGVDTVQLHAEVSAEQLRAVREANPDLVILKSLVVRGDNAALLAATVEATAPYVDMYITDTFNPATGAEGATGLTHDWAISAELVRRSPRPVMLAGGLTPSNVSEAIERVRPAAVDSHTGLEGVDGRKDRDMVREFVAQARLAFDRFPPLVPYR